MTSESGVIPFLESECGLLAIMVLASSCFLRLNLASKGFLASELSRVSYCFLNLHLAQGQMKIQMVHVRTAVTPKQAFVSSDGHNPTHLATCVHCLPFILPNDSGSY